MAHPYPTSVVYQLKDRLDEALAGLYDTYANVAIYAGEFFDLDQIERLARDVRHRPTFFIDLEGIEPVASKNDRTPKDRLIFVVYCCASDLRDEVEQAQASYQRANDARRALGGKEIEAVPNTHTNGFISSLGINKELHYPGLSVHAYNGYVDLTYNLDSDRE